MAKKIYCAFGTDIDSVAGWIGSYGGGDSPSDIQRGIFATEVGIPRLLRLFKKYDLQTSFFIPGHSLETFPKEMKMIVDAGHEVGAHGYLHENPVAMTPQQEEDVLVKSIELIDKLTGRAPRGYVAPWREMSNSTAALLQKSCPPSSDGPSVKLAPPSDGPESLPLGGDIPSGTEPSAVETSPIEASDAGNCAGGSLDVHATAADTAGASSGRMSQREERIGRL